MAAAQKSRSVAPLPAKLAGLLREAKWLALVAAAGYLLLILLTHNIGDPGFSRSTTAATVQNAGGRVGATVSDLLLSVFGWSAFWWAALCIFIVARGYRRLDDDGFVEPRPVWLTSAGFGLLIVASAALEALRLHSFGTSLPQQGGGIVGRVLSDLSSGLLGPTGATLLMLAAVAVGWSLFSGISWLRIAEVTGLLIESAGPRASVGQICEITGAPGRSVRLNTMPDPLGAGTKVSRHSTPRCSPTPSIEVAPAIVLRLTLCPCRRTTPRCV